MKYKYGVLQKWIYIGILKIKNYKTWTVSFCKPKMYVYIILNTLVHNKTMTDNESQLKKFKSFNERLI